MRDTRAARDAQHSRCEASLPPSSSLCIFPPTTPRNVNYPGKYFNFSSKEEDKAVAGNPSCEPGTRGKVLLDLSSRREKKKKKEEEEEEGDRRPFDAHPSIVMFIRTSFLSRILCIPLARGVRGKSLWEARWKLEKSLDARQVSSRVSKMENSGNRLGGSGGQPAIGIEAQTSSSPGIFETLRPRARALRPKGPRKFSNFAPRNRM